MKIAIIGPVFLDVSLAVRSYSINHSSGTSAIEYGGPYLELAKALAEDGHEVLFLSSLSTPLMVPIMHYMQSLKINTDYIMPEDNGLVFNLTLNGPNNLTTNLSSTHCHESVSSVLKMYEDEIFSDLDAVVFSYVDPYILDICKKHASTKLYWYATDEEVEEWDYDDVLTRYIEGVPNVTLDNYREVMK